MGGGTRTYALSLGGVNKDLQWSMGGGGRTYVWSMGGGDKDLQWSMGGGGRTYVWSMEMGTTTYYGLLRGGGDKDICMAYGRWGQGLTMVYWRWEKTYAWSIGGGTRLRMVYGRKENGLSTEVGARSCMVYG